MLRGQSDSLDERPSMPTIRCIRTANPDADASSSDTSPIFYLYPYTHLIMRPLPIYIYSLEPDLSLYPPATGLLSAPAPFRPPRRSFQACSVCGQRCPS
jgi:hypothetical protein